MQLLANKIAAMLEPIMDPNLPNDIEIQRDMDLEGFLKLIKNFNITLDKSKLESIP